MTDRLVVDKPPIEPIYWQAEPSQPIDLGSVEARFVSRGKRYQGKARVTMRFAPRARLMFVVRAPGTHPLKAFSVFFDDNWDGKLKLVDRRVTLDVLCVGTGGEHGAVAFSPKRSVAAVTPFPKGISYAVFHVFNFPDFNGPQDYSLTLGKPPRQGWKLCGRVTLVGDGWAVTVAATDKTDDLCKALGRQGGFAITHMGRIEREDGSTFSGEQLERVLGTVHYFLSFALGRWAGVAFPIGFNKAGKRVFEQWGLPMAADGPWGGSCSWFDPHHGELLPQVFPGFMALWKKGLWHRALTEGLYWYLGACDRGTGIGVDTGLILAQTALELLAWTHCVQDRKMVSAEAFEPRGLSAANRLRLLASSLDIPLELPACLTALHATRGQKWDDSMDAITGIRNAIVHPHAKKQLPHGSYYEGWKLSLWYVDMAILRLCGHTGKYSNRLVDRWMGQVESVPWAQKGPQKAGA